MTLNLRGRQTYQSIGSLSNARGYNLWQAIIRYRTKDDRVSSVNGDLIGSRTSKYKHRPIIDLDFGHHYTTSTTEGHAHLYLDTEIGHVRWVFLMIALYSAGVIERGFFWWSLRRGQNFARRPGVFKTTPNNPTPK